MLKEASGASARGESVTEILLSRNAMSEPDLLGVLADRLNVPPIDLDRIEFPPDVLEWMPHELAKRSGCIPVIKMGTLVTIAVANPFDVVRQDDLRIATGCEVRVCLALEAQIARAMQRIYLRDDQDLSDLLEDSEEHDLTVKENKDDEVTDLASATSESNDAPIVKLVNMIIYQGIKSKASDIHVEPFEKRVIVRY